MAYCMFVSCFEKSVSWLDLAPSIDRLERILARSKCIFNNTAQSTKSTVFCRIILLLVVVVRITAYKIPLEA